MQEQLDIAAALAAIRRRGWIIVLSAIIAVAAAWVITSKQPRHYQATATLFLSGYARPAHGSAFDPVATTVQLTTLAQNSSAAYAQLASSRAVAADAAATLGVAVGRVVGHIEGEAQPGVQLIRVHADGSTGAFAARLANAAAAALSARAPGLAQSKAGGLRLDVVDPAQTPARPTSPRTTLNLVLGGLAGLLLGLALATARERLDRRIRCYEDVRDALGLPVLAELPRIPRRLRRKNAAERHAVPRIADPYRSLATAVAVAGNRDGRRRLMITSPAPAEGKSTVAAHLALSLAQDGESTVLLDCDLYRPSLDRAFPKHDRAPLADVLRATNGSLPDSTEVRPRLKVLAATPAAADRDLSIRSPEFANAIEVAANGHDRVVLDCPPVLGSADTGAIARRSDAAIVVLAADRTREEDALAAVGVLQNAGIDVLGVVLSGVRARGHMSYYGYGR